MDEQRRRPAVFVPFFSSLYANPSVLILDEATSAMGSGVERAVMDTIFSLLPDYRARMAELPGSSDAAGGPGQPSSEWSRPL